MKYYILKPWNLQNLLEITQINKFNYLNNGTLFLNQIKTSIF